MALAQERRYTINDIYALPEGERAELVDGQIYYMAPPGRRHQDILSFLHLAIGNYIAQSNNECKVYPAPFAVFLSADCSKYLEPDISVICDKKKLDERGCNGAPDWIIENWNNIYQFKMHRHFELIYFCLLNRLTKQ